MSRISVIGDGGWGTALALVLHNNGHDVTIWGPFEENISKARQTGKNETFLPGIDIPADIKWTTSEADAANGAEAIVAAIPTKFYADVLLRFNGLIKQGTPVVSVTKGLDRESHAVMTEIARKTLNIDSVCALSGPSHAEEVARGIPTAVVIASHTPKQAADLQQIFSNRLFRVYTSEDVKGVQLGGALKNVIAIAVGISDGLGFGDNTRAALITRGLAEMTRLGTALGCRPQTFAGLSGMGDLIVTCTSQHSRNRGVGERLGKGETLEQIMNSMQQVAEGVWNCGNAYALGQKLGIELPITETVYNILHNGLEPIKAVNGLMNRDVKPE
jgi:glycerol-3-phosphate dehydrogenase (NAD(P)+)